MEQWGFRWIDAKEADPQLVRGMIYDPDNQTWDEESLDIGRAHCEIFRPYFEVALVSEDLKNLGLVS